MLIFSIHRSFLRHFPLVTVIKEFAAVFTCILRFAVAFNLDTESAMDQGKISYGTLK